MAKSTISTPVQRRAAGAGWDGYAPAGAVAVAYLYDDEVKRCIRDAWGRLADCLAALQEPSSHAPPSVRGRFAV
jgi:hypothetical protein